MFQISRQKLMDGFKRFNSAYPFYITTAQDENYQFQYIPINSWEETFFAISPIRTAQPLKSFFYQPVQKVAEYPKTNGTEDDFQPLAIIGPKACDLQALKIIDKVYAEGEYPDTNYVRARKNHIIISTDCLNAGKYCFCTLMNYQPYPESDFDLNLSQIDDRFLIEVGSEKGQEILDTFFKGTRKAPDSLVKAREKLRKKVTEQVKKQNENFHYYQSHQNAIERHLDSEIWADLGKTCVECGICTQICPTCHCFLLYDLPREDRYERIRVWDSCFFAGYSRMAGGLTPRLKLADRFKNRFYHKFDSYVTNFGVEACTGCGRCIEGCMGNIDLRVVLTELEKRVVLKENLDLI
ncbi:hypothetical protein B1H10_02955 [candidate division KSB1 bacterium 4484_188]|nr:MAG: hypothetical protein B1H10_02955 [candidate division KSB1 bacterium 4484_188]